MPKLWTPKVPRNAALLLGLLVLIVVSPSLEPERPAPFVELFFDLVLLSGVASLGNVGGHRIPFAIVTIATLALRWADILAEDTTLVISAAALSMVWVSYAIAIIVPALFSTTEVTLDTIFGAVVVYLLISLAFAFLFGLLEYHTPGSFTGMPAGEAGRPGAVSNALFYFSMTSLTTMGYGDIVPLEPLARSVAVLEGAIGQLYLAVMIARLVGLHIATEQRRR